MQTTADDALYVYLQNMSNGSCPEMEWQVLIDQDDLEQIHFVTYTAPEIIRVPNRFYQYYVSDGVLVFDPEFSYDDNIYELYISLHDTFDQISGTHNE